MPGPNSVMPKPCLKRMFFSRVYFSTSGTGSGAPPDVQKRRDDRSAASQLGAVVSIWYIVGTPPKDRDMLALDQGQHLRRVELADEDRRPAKDDLRQGVDEQPARVEHREDVQIHVVMGHVVDDGVERVPGDHAVGDLRRFGQAGRPAGEDQGGDIFCFKAFTGHGRVRRRIGARFQRAGFPQSHFHPGEGW